MLSKTKEHSYSNRKQVSIYSLKCFLLIVFPCMKFFLCTTMLSFVWNPLCEIHRENAKIIMKRVKRAGDKQQASCFIRLTTYLKSFCIHLKTRVSVNEVYFRQQRQLSKAFAISKTGLPHCSLPNPLTSVNSKNNKRLRQMFTPFKNVWN